MIIETRRVPIGDDELLADLWRCSERFDPKARPPRKLAADEPPDSLAELDGSSLFDRVASRRYEWTQEYTTEGYLELLMTFSNVLALKPRPQSGLLQCTADVTASSVAASANTSSTTWWSPEQRNQQRRGASLTG